MDRERIKQRLVGAVVLVALAVIFIPMILNGNRDETMSSFGSNIPNQPRDLVKLRKMEMPEAKPPPPSPAPAVTPIDEHSAPQSDSAPDGEAVVTSPPPKDEPEAKPEPKPKSDGARDVKQPQGWVVQVASFANRDNALKLRKQLMDRQFNAFVEAVDTDKGTVYRVRVGPEVRREVAEQQQQQIASTFNLKGVVMRHP